MPAGGEKTATTVHAAGEPAGKGGPPSKAILVPDQNIASSRWAQKLPGKFREQNWKKKSSNKKIESAQNKFFVIGHIAGPDQRLIGVENARHPRGRPPARAGRNTGPRICFGGRRPEVTNWPERTDNGDQKKIAGRGLTPLARLSGPKTRIAVSRK